MTEDATAPSEPAPSEVEQRLRALASDRRRQLLHLVRTAERSVGELVEATGLAQPAASQHLKVLRDAGLVRVRAEGTRRWYRADDDGLAAVRSALDDLWSDRLDALVRHAEARAVEREADAGSRTAGGRSA